MVEVILYIVDRHYLSSLLNTPISQLIVMLNNGELRKNRTSAYSDFHRDFDVDLEGELLELFDRNLELFDVDKNILIQHSELKNDIYLILAKWASTAQWSCWDARLFLYVEPYIDSSITGVSDFLRPGIWNQFQDAVSKLDQKMFTESVILDWMNRREKLDETMEPSEDPMILPTMNSHNNLSKSLFNFIKYSKNHNFDLLLGREYLDSELWHIGQKSLHELQGGSI
jgi:hypothetical protein